MDTEILIKSQKFEKDISETEAVLTGLKLHDLPLNWRIVKLGDVVRESIKDGVHKTPKYVAEGIPFITAKDIIDNKISFKRCAYISSEDHANLSKRVHPELDDILLTKVGTVGNVAIVDCGIEFSIFVQVALVKPKHNLVNSEFLFYALQSEFVQNEISNKSSQSTMKFIGTQKIELVQILLPPVAVQNTIAKALRTIQDGIQARRNEIELERERRAALMEYLFTQGTRGETTKQTEIGDIPESWQVVDLGEIITLRRGYDLPSKDRKPGIVPIISSSGISGTHSEAKVTAPGVVTGRYGTIGEVFYIKQDFWPLNTTLYVSEFRRVTPHFIAYLLRTLNFNIFNDKSTVPGVNRNDLHRIKTVLAPPSEQQDIVDVLSAHDTKLSALEQETALLEELFKALLEELMTGRLSTLPLIEEGETHE